MAEGWQGWDDYAPFYDWENAQTLARRDVAFWQRLAAAQNGLVLELGCGTGRLTIPVARTGARIVGIDRSTPMLARARQRLRRLRASALLLRGDIRHLPFRRRTRFALVMAPYGMLQSLTTRARSPSRPSTAVRRVAARRVVRDRPRARSAALGGIRSPGQPVGPPRPRTDSPDRIGPSGSRERADHLRSGVRGAPRRAHGCRSASR